MGIGQVTFRRATLADVEALQLLVQRAYRGDTAAASWSHEGEVATGERISRAAIATLITATTSIVSVAEVGGRLGGTSLVEEIAPEQCTIRLLSVEPALQARGIGSRLLDNAEAEARSCFAAQVARIEVLDQKRKLIAYYERRGYRPTGAARPYPHQLSVPAQLVTFEKRLPD
ncbi:MAG: GNAT family N-acetyltransferase [Sphingomonas sp.]